MGDFFPTDVGLKLMPIATGVSPAGIELAKMLRGSPQDSETSAPPAEGVIEATLRQTSEWADFIAAQDHCDALELELRGPDGAVIPTEWIDVRDTEFLLSLAPEDEEVDGGAATDDFDLPDLPELEESALKFDDGDEWRGEEPFPRYQLQVMLRDAASVS